MKATVGSSADSTFPQSDVRVQTSYFRILFSTMTLGRTYHSALRTGAGRTVLEESWKEQLSERTLMLWESFQMFSTIFFITYSSTFICLHSSFNSMFMHFQPLQPPVPVPALNHIGLDPKKKTLIALDQNKKSDLRAGGDLLSIQFSLSISFSWQVCISFFSVLVFFFSFPLGKFIFCFIFKLSRARAHITVVPWLGATRPASPDSPLSARGAYLKRAVSNFQSATLFDASWWRFLFS